MGFYGVNDVPALSPSWGLFILQHLLLSVAELSLFRTCWFALAVTPLSTACSTLFVASLKTLATHFWALPVALYLSLRWRPSLLTVYCTGLGPADPKRFMWLLFLAAGAWTWHVRTVRRLKLKSPVKMIAFISWEINTLFHLKETL
jgi:hypothetical protein